MGERKKKRVGRGQSSGKGKTSGRGTKGQNARAGNKKRPEMRDIIKKLPKRRGYGKNRGRTVNSSRPRAVVIPLTTLDSKFDSGTEINLVALRERGLVDRAPRRVKIVAGETSKKFTIVGCSVTTSARASIEKAGGVIK